MTAEEYALENMQGCDLQEIENALIGFASLKCKELLEIVAEKAKIELDNDCYGKNIKDSTYSTEREQGFSSTTTIKVNKDSILNAVNLKEFIK